MYLENFILNDTIKITILPSEVLSRERMEDTQDIRGKRSCRDATNNYLKPVSRDTDKPTTHVTLYMRCSTTRVELNWLSCKERRVDALALRAEERRDKLR